MKTLIIHPNNPATDFLIPIRQKAQNATIINDVNNRKEVCKLIEQHDRLVFIGKETGIGLLTMGRHQENGTSKIDYSYFQLLRKKSNILIWSNAGRFMRYLQLQGFSTGMFCSEMKNVPICKLDNVSQSDIDKSNELFAEVVANRINGPIQNLYVDTRIKYGWGAKENNVVRYNVKRFIYRENIKNQSM